MSERGGNPRSEKEREIEREVDRREISRNMERREEERAGSEDGKERRTHDPSSAETRDRAQTKEEEHPMRESAGEEHPEGTGSEQAEGEELRLVTRGVLANSPWKIFLSFKTVIAAAFATGAYALIFPTIWQLGDALAWPRLVALMVTAMLAMVFWMIVGHGLWERRTHEAKRDPRITPAMQNAVTVLTLTLAVLVSYAVLFGFILLAAWVFVSDSIIQPSLGHPIDFGDYLKLAWVATSISTITGTLGSGLEDDTETTMRV